MNREVHEQELSYPVGRYMAPVETAVRSDASVAEALRSLRTRKINHPIVYFYVVDADDRLVGVTPTRRLLLADPQTRIDTIMQQPVISVSAGASLEEAMELFATHRLLALPVIDAEGRLIGHIDVQLYAREAAELAQANRLGDVFQMIGVRLQQARQPSPIGSFRQRMPWLVCNMVGGMLCAVIAAWFEDVLAAVVVLAMFIPLVLTLSESISMQSMALSLQFLHSKGVPWPRVFRSATVEGAAALMMGLTSAIVVGTASLLWGEGAAPAAVIALSITLSMVFSATFGLAVPVTLHALRLDPKLAAGPIALTLSDVTTTAIYLGSATLWLI